MEWLTISDKVNPEELNGDEGFGDTKGSGEENANDFSNVGRDKVTDELKYKIKAKNSKDPSFSIFTKSWNYRK